MKTNQIAQRCILASIFVCLLMEIYYLSNYILPLAKKESWRDFACLFFIQSVIFAVCIFAVFVCLLLERIKKDRTSPFEMLQLINSEGEIKREVLLRDKQAFLITGAKKGKDIFIESVHDPDADRYLYGVCNLVNGYWYFEVLSASRPIGLKRGTENIIYRLKEGMLYQLTAADIIYADTCKIVIKCHRQSNITV